MDIFESLENLPVSEECFEDIISIVEEYINEISVNTWKKAAINSLVDRGFEEGCMDADVNAICKKKRWSNKDEEKIDKHLNAVDRTSHAEAVANLPNSNMSANKVLRAARKAFPLRRKISNKEVSKMVNHEPNRASETADRTIHADHLIPVQKI